MAASTVVHRFTAQQLTDEYHFVCHGPFMQPANAGSAESAKSQFFEEIELEVPEGVELTKELVQKVIGAWIEMNVTNQFLTKTLDELGLSVDLRQVPLYETLKVEEGGIKQLSLSIRNLQDTRKNWESFQDEGYFVTIIR